MNGPDNQSKVALSVEGRNVIATLNKSRAWQGVMFIWVMVAAGLIAAGGICYRLLVHGPSTKLPYRVFSLVVVLISAPFVLRASIGIFRQLAFDAGRTLWIENGNLIRCGDAREVIPCSDIESVTIGRMQRHDIPEIRIAKRDGPITRINAKGLVETPEIIVQRLIDAIPSLNRTTNSAVEHKP